MSGFELTEPKELAELNAEGKQKLESVYFNTHTMLGGTSIPVYLEAVDHQQAMLRTLRTYRSMSARSVNQTQGFLELTQGQSHYQLHERVDNVWKITRSGGAFGGIGQQGQFDPFTAANANLILRGGGAGGPGHADLVTFHLYAAQNETLAKLFAREIDFRFQVEDHTLVIYQAPRSKECVLLECSVLKTVTDLLNDHFSRDWIEKYHLAVGKTILGHKLNLVTVAPGPTGGTVLSGGEIKQQGHDEMRELEDELLVWADSGDIALPVRG